MKSFEYYRYRFAEWLHKLINLLTWTKDVSMGLGYEEDKHEFPKREIPQSWKDHLLKELVKSLLNTLEEDGYLEFEEKEYEDGRYTIEFRLDMLALRAKSIQNAQRCDKNSSGRCKDASDIMKRLNRMLTE